MSEVQELTEVTFRAAASEDVPAVVALVNAAYREKGWTTERELITGDRSMAEDVAASLVRDDTLIMLAEREGDLVACFELQRHGEVCYFGMFSVRPDLQQAGLGRYVLGEAERIATGWGCRTMEMEVITQRVELIAWYERRGYRRTGGTKPFPYDHVRFGVPNRPDLVFITLVKPLGPS